MSPPRDEGSDMEIEEEGGAQLRGPTTQGVGYAIADLDDDEIDEDYIDEEDEDEEGDYFYEDDEDMMDEDDDEDEDGEDDDQPGITFEIATDDELDGEDDDDEDIDMGGGGMTLRQIASLLNSTSAGGASSGMRESILARLLAGASGNSITLRSGATTGGARAARPAGAGERRKRGDKWWTPQKEPHPRGVELLRSGEFGGVGDWEWSWKSTSIGRENEEHDCRAGDRHRRPRGMSRSGHGPGLAVKKMSRATIPNTNGTVVAHYPSVPYVGQYAKEDYSIFFAATQYYTIHLYDVSAQRSFARPRPVARRSSSKSLSPTSSTSPLALNSLATGSVRMPGAYGGMSGTAEPLSALTEAAAEAIDALGGGEEEEDWTDDEDDYLLRGLGGGGAPGRRGIRDEDSSMKKIKTVQGEEGRWTITDCDSTRDGSRMIYSSITPYVHMLHTAEFEAEHTCLDFTGQRRRGHGFDGWGYDGFGIWSIRFSADGKEVVAGAGSGKILVYDIEAERRSLSISGHSDDVNAVCFADESSTNILVSGSDDGYVKIWDRRSLASQTPSGVLVGATEGITYTSPKGDGRYIVVNSKDQAARLYDLRKMRQWSEFEGERNAVVKYGQGRYDYRNSHYPTPKRLAHPLDCSVMTYRGHAVLRTLIRCHFSPRESTGQGYIYSGSADGMIHIWSLDGRVVQVLDRSRSIPLRQPNGEYSDPSAPEQRDPSAEASARARAQQSARYGTMDYCTRDVSWHGYEPTLMSSSWEMEGGYRRDGSVAKHEWKGLGKGGMNRLEDWVEKEKQEQGIQEE